MPIYLDDEDDGGEPPMSLLRHFRRYGPAILLGVVGVLLMPDGAWWREIGSIAAIVGYALLYERAMAEQS